MGQHASGSSAIVVVSVIAAAVLRGSVCTDVTHGTVSSLPHPPPPPLGGRDHPPVLPAPLPSSLQVDVTLGQAEVHLHLLEDPEFEPEVPVWELYTDSDGKQQTQPAALRTPEYSVYHDLQKEADVMVFRDTDDNGTSLYRLEGVVHSGGQLYDLKSTGRRLRRRHRRQTQGADGLHHSNHSSGAQGGDGEEEEEIEATRLTDWQADVADYVSITLDVQTTKKMKGEITVPRQANLSSPLNPSSPFQSPSLPHRSPPSQRKRRAVTQDIHVDVVALVDYGVYQSWYDRSNETEAAKKKEDALQKIRRYYAFVLNGVNTLYHSISSLSYTIHVRLSSVMVATTQESSHWTEQYRVNGTPWDEVNANMALLAVSNWAATTDLLPPHDHLMLFTGYDLTKTSSAGITSDKITGLAYTSTLCDTGGKATSIVEDLGGFQSIGTATHELGHGLSAEHDGNENQCRSEDRYIMAAGSYDVTSTNKLNPWKFSSCSVNYFSTFIDNNVGTSRGRTCLYNALAVSDNIPDVTSQVEGQLYDADAQCRQVYGADSRLCRGPEFGDAADVCTEMFCYDPSTASTCYQLVAARGTTCGNGKWCENGQCVSSSRAPSVDENCVFGDQPGPAFEGVNCTTFVDNFPGYCYQEVVRVRCCASCARHYRLVRDCEYGDNATGCSAISCSFATTSYRQKCCGTCDYGSTFTTTTTTTTTTTPTTTTTTTSTSTRSTSSTTSAGTTAVVCADNSSVTINQMTCPALVSANPRYCYDATVISICCLSCRQASTGVADCEYGDRRPDCAANSDDCQTQQHTCCDTCAGYAGDGVHVTADVMVHVIAAVLSLMLFSIRTPAVW